MHGIALGLTPALGFRYSTRHHLRVHQDEIVSPEPATGAFATSEERERQHRKALYEAQMNLKRELQARDRRPTQGRRRAATGATAGHVDVTA